MGQRRNTPNSKTVITLFLCGDVMTGRAIDQVLPHPGDPRLHEPTARDARGYVRLAEAVSGPIGAPVDFAYIWGDALAELERRKPDIRLINLETAVSDSDDHWPAKGIHYRMHPRNLPAISAAAIHCCTLANNHVLDGAIGDWLRRCSPCAGRASPPPAPGRTCRRPAPRRSWRCPARVG